MKILNLYSGLGGNRTLWRDVDVTAVEINESIAAFYRDRFPDDTVIIGNAHEYLRKHYKDFDFIWSSVPCQSHSRARFWTAKSDDTKVDPIYPDMSLYQEILFLKHYYRHNWIVENVCPYYEPLIEPQAKIGRHLFWSNRKLNQRFISYDLDIQSGNRAEYEAELGFSINGYEFDIRTVQILRNCVHPKLGLQLLSYFDRFVNEKQNSLFKQFK